jgi:hypothetical protein
LISQSDISDKRFRYITKLAHPAIVTYPGKLAFGPNTESKGMTDRVILFSHMWKVDIADPVQLIKGDEQ